MNDVENYEANVKRNVSDALLLEYKHTKQLVAQYIFAYKKTKRNTKSNISFRKRQHFIFYIRSSSEVQHTSVSRNKKLFFLRFSACHRASL